METEVNTPVQNKGFSGFVNRLKQPDTQAIVMVLVIALLVRIVTSLLFNTGHPTDINNFRAWTIGVTQKGIYEFFQPPPVGIWCDYPPGYIYILYFFGFLYSIFDPDLSTWHTTLFTTFVKFPGIIADIINVYLIYALVKRYVPSLIAYSSAAIYAFHPAMYYESAVWGQMDSVSFLFLLLSIQFLIDHKYAASVFVTALGVMMKPQGILLIPFIGSVILYNKAYKQLGLGILASFAFVFAITLPVTRSFTEVIPWLWSHYMDQANLYPYSSIQTFNLWGLTGLWRNDSRTILGITHKTWGLVFYLAFYASAIYYYIKKAKLNEGAALIHGATLVLVGFYFLPTRMHERYLFAGLSMLAISAGLNFRLHKLYLFMSATFLINILYELPGDKTNLGLSPMITGVFAWLKQGNMITENFGFFNFTPIIILNLILFAVLTARIWKDPLTAVDDNKLEKLEKENAAGEKLTSTKVNSFSIPVIQKFDKLDWLIVIGISAVSLAVRLFYLSFPEEMIFDEVYHARAAGEYMRGLHPYEWVHPPLAKLIISVGTTIFGLNSFGWRIMPVIFGTLFVPVMYYFGKSLFGKRGLGILAAVLVSIDGVFFVQSRTAMTNIFATFFQIASIMFFWLFFQFDNLREKKGKAYLFLFLSGLFISLALATRWTSMGTLAFIFGATVWYKFFFNITLRDIFSGNFKGVFSGKKLKSEIIFWIIALLCFAVLPAVVYFIAYIPYMSLGHTMSEVINMQKGIYSYHKNLREPHPYYSEWYTWPFLVRPTWYYFRDFKDGTLAGIIALGNPAIWWSSVFATAYVLYKGIKEKHSSLLFVGLAFIILYLPWAVSPRIKNYSHYLFEAIPYACLAITYIVGELWYKGNLNKVLTRDDHSFNKLALASIALLAVYLIFIGILALWTLQFKNPFPIAFLAPYSKQLFNSATFVSISLFGVILYTLYENSKFRTLAVIYVSTAVMMFMFFYPLYAGYPMYWWYYSMHIWFSTWI